jgi:hypothetical protein
MSESRQQQLFAVCAVAQYRNRAHAAHAPGGMATISEMCPDQFAENAS